MEPINLNLFRINSTTNTNQPLRLADAGAVEGKPFSEVLQESIHKVSDLQQGADKAIQRLALGEVEDISEVSISVEKAELALRLMVQIRDKLVDAYQQVARMSV